ncbi:MULTISPECIES: RNA polymerase sigma factor [Rhodopseudomonas]|uniref:RNA polymerase subunit sigma-24 n=1 Tax=Rhodopseudomonas palustris TaxID=1076 RepID=A0A0D7EFG4_RHOPL|nr:MULTISPECIES: RNA polymerase sigma factor [Rhodopseudomonas]KIZ38297.1 RNA polymerase subunit sigma-24 [Rhodopseudomonas palustris]MDF3812378.1 RNA polymerase sigma factor [Rhodopseudomonas sp. BAL398]WOK20410.1 RNA polymerase sigma factor [Rhodopseudomonas sp. BAL398]
MDEIAAEIEPLIPSLRRYARALLHDRDAADDLVQATLERALTRWRLRRPGGDLRAWLFTIERNLYLDQRRRAIRRGHAVEIDARSPLADGAAGPERNLIARDALARLDDLPEDQRSLLLLIGVEELSYEQAARIFDVPVGTIMSRLSRAREALRSSVETGRATVLRRVK